MGHRARVELDARWPGVGMHPDLDAIVAADEEGRSRVTLAGERRDRDLISARGARDTAISRRTAHAHDTLEAEMEAICAEGSARLEELRRKQARYLAELAEAGERNLEEAVQRYLRIVCTPEEHP